MSDPSPVGTSWTESRRTLVPLTWQSPQALTPTPGPNRFEPRMRALGLTQSGDVERSCSSDPLPTNSGHAAREYQNVTVALNRTSRGAVIAVVFRYVEPSGYTYVSSYAVAVFELSML